MVPLLSWDRASYTSISFTFLTIYCLMQAAIGTANIMPRIPQKYPPKVTASNTNSGCSPVLEPTTFG
jgi:hypothetical protein